MLGQKIWHREETRENRMRQWQPWVARNRTWNFEACLTASSTDPRTPSAHMSRLYVLGHMHWDKMLLLLNTDARHCHQHGNEEPKPDTKSQNSILGASQTPTHTRKGNEIPCRGLPGIEPETLILGSLPLPLPRGMPNTHMSKKLCSWIHTQEGLPVLYNQCHALFSQG